MFTDLLLLAHVIVSILLVILVLLQRSDGGLGALGGGGNAVFSSVGSSNPLATGTKYLAILFMGLSLLLATQMSGASRPQSVVDAEVNSSVEVNVETGSSIPAVPINLAE